MSILIHGFDSKIFVTNPSKTFECAVCLNVLNDPKQCSNGHCFCNGCISGLQVNILECPVCGCEISIAKLRPNLFAKQVISEMLTYCRTCDGINISEVEHCPWIGPMYLRVAHCDEDCGFVDVSCTNYDCQGVLQRRQLADHLLSCDHRPVVCEYCSLQVKSISIARHKITCLERPVECNNHCGLSLPFSTMNAHKRGVCPLEPIECPLSKLQLCKDCTGQVHRRDFEAHMSGPCEMTRSGLLELTGKLNRLIKVKESDTSRETKDALTAHGKFVNEVDDLTFAEKRMDSESRELLLKWSSECPGVNNTSARKLIADHLSFSHPTINACFIACEFTFTGMTAANTQRVFNLRETPLSLTTNNMSVLPAVTATQRHEMEYKLSLNMQCSSSFRLFTPSLWTDCCYRVTVLDFNSRAINHTYKSHLLNSVDTCPGMSAKFLQNLTDRRDGRVKVLFTVYSASKSMCLQNGL